MAVISSFRVCPEFSQDLSIHPPITFEPAKMTALTASADAFWNRYVDALTHGKELMDAPDGAEGQARIDRFCKDVVSYRLPQNVTFGLPTGQPFLVASHEQAEKQFSALIKRYCEFGIGFESEVRSNKIQVLYDYGGHGVCLFHVDYIMKPHSKSGLEPWDCHVVYSYRKLPNGEEGLESGYVDDEIAKVLEKVGPEVFEGLGP